MFFCENILFKVKIQNPSSPKEFFGSPKTLNLYLNPSISKNPSSRKEFFVSPKTLLTMEYDYVLECKSVLPIFHNISQGMR